MAEEILERLREIAGGRVLLRQTEAAEALGITERRLISEVAENRLRYVLIGKRRRFKPAELCAYIERLQIPRSPPEPPELPLQINAAGLLWRVKSGAKLRRKIFDLALSDVEAMIERAAGRCEVSGIPFSERRIRNHAPFAPSIDRIDSDAGYTRGNCRLVCFAVNVALYTWGDEILRKIALGIVERGAPNG